VLHTLSGLLTYHVASPDRRSGLDLPLELGMMSALNFLLVELAAGRDAGPGPDSVTLFGQHHGSVA
jgi:hypothetical protein